MKQSFETLHGHYIEDLETGMSASVSKVFSESDVAVYAELSTDHNPLHMNEEFAARTRTGGRVLHGMISAGLISAIIGTRLPGPGCLWMAQEMRFLAPVRIGEAVHAAAEVIEVDAVGQRTRMKTVCRVADKTVLDGEALIWVPSRSA